MILTSHSQLHITYETAYATMVRHLHRPKCFEACLREIATFPQFNGVDINGLRDDIQAEGVVTFADLTALIYRRIAALNGKSRWGDKNPAYTRNVLDLAMMFPAARFIHVVRDPRGVAVSWIPTNWGPNTYWHAGRWWATAVAQATANMEILEPWRTCTIRFEDLVREPERTMRGVCEFLDLEWEPQVLDSSSRSQTKLPSSQDEKLHWKARKDIDPERAESWRRVDPRKLRHLEAVCWDLMKIYDYEPLGEEPVYPAGFEQVRYKIANRLCSYQNRARKFLSGIRPPKHAPGG
jgi:hypothetical protein